MTEAFDRKKVELSFRRFNDFANDVISSEYSTFDSNLRIFINHCENDEIMSVICNPLKRDDTILDKWWSENMSRHPNSPEGRKFNQPLDENERAAFLYQICLKINNGEINLTHFCIHFNCNVRERISFFNKIIIHPMVRSIGYKLEEIMYGIETDLRNERYIPMAVFNVYQDFSTIVKGNVNTKGDSVIGGGSSIEKSIEKKSLI